MSDMGKSLGKCYIQSRIGGRSENQDSAGIIDTEIGTVVVVCDGMGALNGGSVASKIAVKTILEEFSKGHQDPPSEMLKNAIISANNAIIDAAESDPDLMGMGTTVTALVINEECATVAYLGDSRVYQLRGRRKVFRTFDHSVVFNSVALGVLTEEQARLSSQSNVITKALGIRREIEVDIYELPYSSGDRFILCTDGFWGAMPEKEFIKLVARGNICKTLDRAIAHIDQVGAISGGHHDNLTAAFFDVNIRSKKKSKGDLWRKAISFVLLALTLVVVGFTIYQHYKKDSSLDTKELLDTTVNKSDNDIAEESNSETDISNTTLYNEYEQVDDSSDIHVESCVNAEDTKIEVTNSDTDTQESSNDESLLNHNVDDSESDSITEDTKAEEVSNLTDPKPENDTIDGEGVIATDDSKTDNVVNITAQSETVVEESETTEEKSETVAKESENTEEKSETVAKESGDTEEKSETVVEESKNAEEKSEVQENNSNNLDEGGEVKDAKISEELPKE